MKKINLLMLLTSVFLLFNCRTELANEEKTDEVSTFHSQNNKITFREFLKITQNNEDDLLNSKSGKNSSLNEFDIDTSYILKRTEEANITKFSLLLKKKNETNKNIVYNMLYYRTKLGEWKYFIIKVEHSPNPNKLYGWKKTSLYKLQDDEASKGCNSSYQFGNIDWFQCSAGHGPDCSRNGGACCAGCHHSMAVSYWVNSCDQSAPGEFDINYGGGSGNPITMEDVKNAIKNNVSAETYQKFLSIPYNLQQGVISCFYNDYLANDLVSAIIDFFYTHPNTQNPDVIYYRLSDFIKNFTLNQQDWLKNNLHIALPLLDHYTNNNNLQFSNWAINFFIENPNTSWTQFQNWFLNPNSLSFDNNININNSIIFNDLQSFKSSLLTKNNNLTTESSILQDNGTERIVSARIKRTGVWGSGEEVRIKLKKVNNIWTFDSVTSSEYGMTLGVWSFTQLDYSQNTNSNVLTVEVTGLENYNIFLEGLGTVYKDRVMIRIKININTGNIFSIEFIDL